MSDQVAEITYVGNLFEKGRCFLCTEIFTAQQFCTLPCGHLACLWCLSSMLEVKSPLVCPQCKGPSGLTKDVLAYYIRGQSNPHVPLLVQLAEEIDIFLSKDLNPAFSKKLLQLLDVINPAEWGEVKTRDCIAVSHVVASLGHVEHVEKCHQHGLLEALTLWKTLPVHFAAQCGHDVVLKWILDRYPHQLNATGIFEQTPLYYASWKGQPQCVQVLIEAKADINKSNKDRDTPLIAAIYKGNLECAKILVEAKADINEKTANGETALIIAAWQGYVDGVKLLIEAGASLNEIDNKGRSALRFAIDRRDKPGCEECIQLLKNAGGKKIPKFSLNIF